MSEELRRFALLVSEDGLERLASAHVAIIGVGGVGGSAAHALARAGVGHLTIVDHDRIEKSNINRQVVAYQSTIGKLKVDVLKEQILDINPAIKVDACPIFVTKENYEQINWRQFDFVIDAVDNISTKLLIIEKCLELKILVVSALGAGNRLDPSKITICDIYATANDPLAKVMRHELRKRNILHLPVAASSEQPIKPYSNEVGTVGSSPFVPPAMGLLIASYVTQTLTKVSEKHERFRNGRIRNEAT